MTQEIEIYEGQDFYIPYFQVKIQGRPQGADVIRDIMQVTYKDDINEIDSFELTVNNWDAETLAFKYSDAKVFDPGQEIELWMGYYGKERQRLMLKGEITSMRPTFPASGQPTLAISGLNLLHKLRKKQESHPYIKKTDSQIAKEIEGRLGIKIKTKPENEQPYEYLLQDNKYDIIFLMERARSIGYDLFVKDEGENGKSEESVLHFVPSESLKKVTYILHYGRSLIDFQPTLTTANQVGQVTVRGWDPKKKTAISHTAKRTDIPNKGLGNVTRQKLADQSFNQREEIIADRPIESKAEAQKLAEQTLNNIVKDMVKASGTVVGLPDLRAGNMIHIKGVGNRFSGHYFVKSTTHSISDGGYTTKFEGRLERVDKGV